jgi:hypothetical protein
MTTQNFAHTAVCPIVWAGGMAQNRAYLLDAALTFDKKMMKLTSAWYTIGSVLFSGF